MAQSDFPTVHFVVSHDGPFGLTAPPPPLLPRLYGHSTTSLGLGGGGGVLLQTGSVQSGTGERGGGVQRHETESHAERWGHGYRERRVST